MHKNLSQTLRYLDKRMIDKRKKNLISKMRKGLEINFGTMNNMD